jgi:UrcA family protein
MNTQANDQAPTERTVRVSHPRITLAMILCGIVSAAGIGAASAATPTDQDAPSTIVKYRSENLSTDAGAQDLYRRIVKAAEQVCPANPGSSLLSAAVLQCRAQSISRAVTVINNSRLAAVHESATRTG